MVFHSLSLLLDSAQSSITIAEKVQLHAPANSVELISKKFFLAQDLLFFQKHVTQTLNTKLYLT